MDKIRFWQKIEKIHLLIDFNLKKKIYINYKIKYRFFYVWLKKK